MVKKYCNKCGCELLVKVKLDRYDCNTSEKLYKIRRYCPHSKLFNFHDNYIDLEYEDTPKLYSEKELIDYEKNGGLIIW